MPLPVFHAALRQIYETATAYDAPYPVYRTREDLRKIPKPWGLAYWVAPRKQRVADYPWFSEIRTNLELRKKLAEAPSFDDDRPRLFLLWPYLLENAFDPDLANRLRVPAWTILLQLRPLIAKFDRVLEWLLNDLTLDDIETASKPLAIKLAKEHWFHLTRKNRVFRRALTETMNHNLRSILDTHSYQEIRACPTKHKVTFDKKCDECAAFRWLDYGVTIVWTERLAARDLTPIFFTIPSEIEGFFPHPGHGGWDAEFLWMLSCVSPDEGVILTEDNHLIVNFSRLAEIAETLKRDSILRRFTGTAWQRGLDACRHCSERASLLISRRSPMMERVSEVGWELGDQLTVPYEQFSIPAIRRRLKLHDNLLTRYATPVPKKRARRDVVRVDYVDTQGVRHEVEVFFRLLHQKRTLYAYVYWLDGMPADKPGYKYRFEGRDFWTLRGVLNNPRGYKEQAELEAFEKWFLNLADEMTPAAFKKLLYSQRLNERVDALQKGKRQHLTRYAEVEDERIRAFASNRSPGPLDDAEWANLHALMPGRQKLGIMRRWRELAESFALVNGWEGYMNSGWRIKYSAKRRKKWLNLGVPA